MDYHPVSASPVMLDQNLLTPTNIDFRLLVVNVELIILFTKCGVFS